MFRTVPSVYPQEIFIVNTAMVYVIQVLLTACEQDQDGTASWSCLRCGYSGLLNSRDK